MDVPPPPDVFQILVTYKICFELNNKNTYSVSRRVLWGKPTGSMHAMRRVSLTVASKSG